VAVYGFTLNLRDDPEAIERYRWHHRHVWPLVVDRLRGAGVRRLRIFLLGRRLFMYMEAAEGFDPDRDLAALMDDPEYVRWEDLMRTLQERLPGSPEGVWWQPMDEIYDLEDDPATRGA
jgi:L-rhamnose mutarotase